MSVLQHTAWAQRNGKHELTSYIERGGLPPVIGEWALAGELMCHRCNAMAGMTVSLQCLTQTYDDNSASLTAAITSEAHKANHSRAADALWVNLPCHKPLKQPRCSPQAQTITLRRAHTRKRYSVSSRRSRRRTCSQAARAPSFGRSRTTSAMTCGASRVRCATAGSVRASLCRAVPLDRVRAALLQGFEFVWPIAKA